MKRIRQFLGITLLCLLAGVGFGAEPAAQPLFTLEAQGPTAQVTAVAFSPDGRTLYAAGYDKVVRVWKLQDGQFVLDARHPGYRVPVGPGREGAINAIAVSPDGAWLAVTGLGLMRGAAGFDKPGFDADAAGFSDDMWRDRGVIEVFSLRDADQPVIKHLRGHRGDVVALAFAPVAKGQPLRLVSAAWELRDRSPLRFTGQVRLWDVDRPTTLAMEDSAQPVGPRPGLACWGAGPGFQVAVTWGDGRMTIWQPAAGAGTPARAVPDGRPGFIHPLASYRSGDQDHLLSCSWERGAWLRGWAVPPGQQAEQQRQLPPPGGMRSILPVALTVVSSRADGAPDHAAVVARLKTMTDEYVHRLYLVRLADFQVVAEKDLWGWGGNGLPWDPVLAAAPRGQHLAVAGNGSHQIWIYSIPDLLNGKAKAIHLEGRGAVTRSLTFVHRGQGPEVSLFLSPARKRGPGAAVDLTEGGERLVFDFLKPALLPFDPGQGWRPASPADAAWKVRLQEAPANARRWLFAWNGPSNRQGTFTVEPYPGEELTDYALVPSGKLPEPVLVVSSWRPDKGEPRLNLYNGRSQRFRSLVGHRDRILALAVSADGKLLASTGQDQTVCLWGLTDLDGISGRHAMPAGVDVNRTPDGKTLVVTRAMQDLQGPQGLQVGDRIKAQVFPRNKGERPFTSPAAFYAAVWESPPDRPLRLRIERGGREQLADMAVLQGVDDRKSLLTLFVTEDAKRREWIAWTPVGPYDRSGAGAERFLGWQFNPAKPDEPTRFAAAAAYRGQFYTPRLLPAIARTADLGRALEEIRRRPVPKTGLGAAIYEKGVGPQPADAHGQVLVRQPQVTLDVTVRGAEFQQKEVESIALQVGDGKPEPLNLADVRGQTVSAPVQLPARRGVYPVHLLLRTREDRPQVIQQTVALRYQPPAPDVNFDPAWLRGLAADGYVVSNRKLTVQARAQQGSPGAAITLVLTHNKQTVRLPPGLDIKAPLDLDPGDNIITLQAVNQGALNDFTDAEASPVRRLVVHYREEGNLSLVVQEVVTATDRHVAVQPNVPTVVDTPRVRVIGRIQGAAPLVAAGWSQEKPAAQQGTLRGFKTGAANGLDINQEFTLEPGRQDITLTAGTKGKNAKQTLALVYQPALPALTLTPLPERIAGRDPATLDLVAFLTAAEDNRPFQVKVRANGVETNLAVGAGRLQPGTSTPVPLGKLALKRGSNCIEIQLTNEWGASRSGKTEVIYRVPPRILSLTSPQLAGRSPEKPWDGKPNLELVAEVESPDKPDASLAGVDLPSGNLTVAPLKEGGSRWQVRAANVPLKEGTNRWTLNVRNADGPCLEPRSLEVAYSPPRPPPAIVFPELADNIQVQDPAYTVRFRVRSQVRLRGVELIVANAAGRKVTPIPDAANRQAPEPDGAFLLAADLGVTLEPGANQVTVRAVTQQDIRQEDTRVISYVPRPARLIVKPPSKEAPGARLTLQGQVVWDQPAEEPLVDQRLRRLAVYVNGFRQKAAQVATAVPGQKERHFTVSVLLNREGANQIEVDCPGLPLALGGRQAFTVNCAHPEPPRTLHLLVVGVGKKRQEMEERALKALQVPEDRLAPHNGSFERIIMHPYSDSQRVRVLADTEVLCGRVRGALHEMRRFIEENGSAADVAMVYWLGSEAVNEDQKLCLPTSESLPGERLTDTAISMEELLDSCQEMPGAQVLLFDLAGRKPVALDLASTRAAVLRETWSRKEPYPGLLEALKRASDTGRPASLQAVVHAAEKLRTNYPGSLPLDHNLKTFPFLADLIVSLKPKPAP